MFVFVTTTVGLLLAWSFHVASITTGDEPHYLIVADAISVDRTFNPENSYVREVRRHADYPPGLPLVERVMEENAPHLVHGPHGWYSVHGVGLSLLIAPAAAIGGESGARSVSVATGLAVVVLLWAMSGRFLASSRIRAIALTPLCLALPVVSAATQIYPDLAGGALCLLGLLGIIWAREGMPMARLLVVATAVAFLPWLHLRFAVPATLLVAAITWASSRRDGGISRTHLVLTVPLATSAVALAIYNWWAFGSVSGPYGGEAMSIGRHSLMVLVGLGVDQNQGILAQQPLHLVGLFFLVAFVRRHRLLGGTMIAVIAAIVLPSAAHPAWYGGYAFAGRFGWAPSLVLMPATLFGLGWLSDHRRVAFRWAVALGVAVQLWYLGHLFTGFERLYPVEPAPHREAYSIHFSAIGRWLPSLYDTAWAFRHLPNAIAVVLAVAVVLVGGRTVVGSGDEQ